MRRILDLILGGKHVEWNDNPDYRPYILYKGEFWWLYLNKEQSHLGRAYVWLMTDHVTNQGYETLENHELRELRQIIRWYREVLDTMWRPELLNCHWDGNETQDHDGHGHMHLIPRYKTPRWVDSLQFKDENFGKNYAPYKKRNLNESELQLLVTKLKEQLRDVVSTRE